MPGKEALFYPIITKERNFNEFTPITCCTIVGRLRFRVQRRFMRALSGFEGLSYRERFGQAGTLFVECRRLCGNQGIV